MGLTEEQRAAVASLLAKRATTLAATAEADRPAVLEAAEKELATVLTEPQLAEFVTLKPEPLLKFCFRYQRWDEVLQWFAEEADLSLVMDVPPPGTFNYTDSREYTPTEAIDLLNGVLLTKGYTLIRRGRMMTLVELSEGIPEGLIPAVSLEELDNRGKFELVTVRFLLGRRSLPTVTEAITPLLGSHGKVVPMPTAGQIMVTDTAGVLHSIGAVIESVPELPVRPRPALPDPLPPPVLEVYPIAGDEGEKLIETLKPMVPDAQLTVDPIGTQLVAWGTPQDHETLKSAFEKLGQGGPLETARIVEVYRLRKADPEAMVELLETLVPRAKLSADSPTRSIVAVATISEHRLIRDTLEQLKPDEPGPDTPVLKIYALSRAPSEELVSGLKELVPGAQITADPAGRRLMVIAPPEEQKLIEEAVGQIEADGPRVPQLQYYELDQPAPPTLATGLKQLVPQAEITLEPDGKRLLVIGLPEDQQVVASALKKIDLARLAQLQLRFYPLIETPPPSLLTALSQLVPKAQVTLEPESKRLMVVASDEDHQLIESTLKQVETTLPPPQKPQLVVYSVDSAQRKRFMAVMTTWTAPLWAMLARLTCDGAWSSVELASWDCGTREKRRSSAL